MCGLAGYNVSPEWAQEYLDLKKQKEIIRVAWLHNLHRGKDAAGFMALRENGKINVFKQAGAADKVFNKLKDDKIGVTRVLGAHTRAKTRGDAQYLANNHPVYWNNVWTTHNGTIQNDLPIKKRLKDPDLAADVDSVAISIMLSEVKDPYDIDELEDALCALWGSFAIHSIWRDHPGLSLLARGAASPLIVGYHAAGAVIYGSEPESVWAIINAMGLDPKDEGWTYRELKENSLILVKDGIPVAYSEFSHILFERNKVPWNAYRMVKDGKGEPQVVYLTDSSSDFANKNGAMGRDIRRVPDEKVEITYSWKEGSTNPKETFPRPTDSGILSVFSEADLILENKVSGNYHVFYDDIELIVTNGRLVRDVYNNSRVSMEERWHMEDKEAVRKANRETFDSFADFLEKRSSKVVKTVTDGRGKFAYEIPPVQSYQNNWRQNNVQQLPLRVDNAKDTSKHLTLVRPRKILNLTNVFTTITEHTDPNYGDLSFMGNHMRCVEHDGVTLQEHPHPYRCGRVKAEAIRTLSCAEDLEIISYLLPESSLIKRMGQLLTPCEDKHDWAEMVLAEFALSNDTYMEVPLEMYCLECESEWKIANLPGWLEKCMSNKTLSYSKLGT